MKRLIVSFITFSMLLSLTATSQIINEAPVDGLFSEEVWSVKKEPIPYPPIRKADVMWQKRIWREIDFKQKFNQKFYYPIDSQANWKSFINTVLDALKEGGEMTAYDISNTDELLVPITYNEIIGRQTDTLYEVSRRPYPPYEEYDTLIITEFDPSQVMRLRIKEDWYFDKQRSQMMVRIIALCPVLIVERDGQEHKFINGVWGIFGHGNVAGIGEALEQNRDLKHYLPRNEQGMVHAAVAYAKQHKRLKTYACTTSIGPGATNMITAAAGATINRLPVLLLPGDIFSRRNVGPVLQQLEHTNSFDVSVNDCFKPVSVFVFVLGVYKYNSNILCSIYIYTQLTSNC